MRPVLYKVAASLDGYIAGPNGELDWIHGGSFEELKDTYASVDTALLGRRTYELTLQPGAPSWPAAWTIVVFSRTLDPEEHPDVRIVSEDAAATVAELRRRPGRAIWLFGGAGLFRSLLDAGQVDVVEITIIPVLLGGGVPLLEAGRSRTGLTLETARPHPGGAVTLRYRVSEAGDTP